MFEWWNFEEDGIRGGEKYVDLLGDLESGGWIVKNLSMFERTESLYC